MGRVYDEFAHSMEGWRRQYAGQPEQEMEHLLFLGLEREEVVSVGYRETLILRRLKTMPLEPAVQELIHHALVWAWKDEQMHAIYLRGAIVRMGSRLLHLRAFLKQIMGAAGGWAGSVRQHVPWSQAPFSHVLATVITWTGALTGQVPRDVRDYLRYRPFRDFCIFNIDAEKTAALCYERMLELIPLLPALPPTLPNDIRRVWEDEERHARIFEIVAEALDDQDRLAPGETAATLVTKIAAAGEYFLPRSFRGSGERSNRLDHLIRVWVRQGTSATEKLPFFRHLLDETRLPEQIAHRAQALGKSTRDLRIAIKASFMLGYQRKDRSVITDPELVDALARYLQEQGCREIAVVEARNLYDRFYAHRMVHDVAAYFGFVSPAYQVVDLSEEQVPHAYDRGLAQYTAGRTWQEADFRINFGKMRSHASEQVYLTVGALDGLGARVEEFLFVERQAHRDTAIMMLLSDFPPHFALLDAYDSAADGLLGMMGCPRPPAPRRLYASTDALALDMVAARHMGLRDPRASIVLNTACHWFGDPTPHTQVVGVNRPLPGWRGPYHNGWTTLLSLLAYPVYEFASGRGVLFVPEMDLDAFPPLAPESLPLRMGRRLVQTLLGSRHRS
jgi:uncharacterized protein (DUF362 family)